MTAALAAMGGLVRGSVPDWIDAMRKRWLVALALAVFVDAVAILIFQHDVRRGPSLLQNVDGIASGVLAICVFADAMRLTDPGYRITYERFGRLLWLTFYMGIIILGAAIPYFVLNAVHQSIASAAFVLVVATILGSRLCLAYYLSERKERPVLLSFLLTGGPTFVPSIILVAATGVPRFAFDPIFRLHAADSVERAIVYTTAFMALQFACATWQYPLTVRWLPVCERLHPEVDANAYPLLQDPDANLV